LGCNRKLFDNPKQRSKRAKNFLALTQLAEGHLAEALSEPRTGASRRAEADALEDSELNMRV